MSLKKWVRRSMMAVGGGLVAASQLVQGMNGWFGIAGAFIAGVAKHVPGLVDERKGSE